MYILEKIYEIARDTPDKIAIVNDGVEYGYRHFYQAVMAVRRRLEPEGRSDGRVGTFLVRSIVDAWATSMALSSLGYATLALPRGADAAHLGRLDVALMVVRTAEGRRGEALTNVPAGAKVVEIDSDFATDGLAEGELPSPPLEPMVGGHIMLTSGTTGAYKCMQIPAEREALLKLVPPSDSVLNLLQFNLWTAVGCSSPLGAWCGGAAVIFQREPDLYKSFNYKRITHAFATPAFLASILSAPEGSFPRHEGLRLTVFGGALSARQAAEARRRIATTVLASFGSSEVGNWALTEIKTDEDLKWHQVTAGWTVEVVDEADGVLPVGQLGRLRVKVPPGIPQEYHRDPDATASHFRDGWFYPGDLAVMDAAGLAGVPRPGDQRDQCDGRQAAGRADRAGAAGAARRRYGVRDVRAGRRPGRSAACGDRDPDGALAGAAGRGHARRRAGLRRRALPLRPGHAPQPGRQDRAACIAPADPGAAGGNMRRRPG